MIRFPSETWLGLGATLDVLKTRLWLLMQCCSQRLYDRFGQSLVSRGSASFVFIDVHASESFVTAHINRVGFGKPSDPGTG